MKQSTPPVRRRTAAVGATVALVAVTSMIGIGSTAAVADTTDAGTISSAATTGSAATNRSAATTATTADGTTTTSAGTSTGTSAGTTAPHTVVEPAAPTTDPSTAAPTADPTDGADGTPAAADPADGTDATPAAGDAADGADATPGTGTPSTGTDATSAAAPAAASSVTWDQPSSPSNRIVWTVTAGSDFSHQFVAHGGDGPLEYGFNPSIGFDALKWFSWGDDGLLRGKPTVVGVYDFDVLATDTRNTATQYVRIVVEPGAAETIGAQVYSHEDGHNPSWSVSAGGDIDPSGGGGLVDAVPVAPGGSLWTSAVVFDHYSNPLNGPEMPSESVLTSSDPDDVLVWNAETNTWKTTFAGAGDRTLTLTSEGLSVPIAVHVAETPLAFAGPGTSDSLRTTAGVRFWHTFATTGGTGDVRYALQYPSGEPFEAERTDARFPNKLAWDGGTGTLSGTPTVAGDYRFLVVATDGTQVVRRDVHMVVSPGATTHLQTFMSADPQTRTDTTWGFGPGDQLIRIDGSGESATHTAVDSIPVRQGDSLYVKTTPMDAWGNATVSMEPAPGDTRPTVTSSVGSDEVSFVSDVWSTKVRFPHASVHTLTVSLLGATSTFDVSVTPVASGSSNGGSLAYTGADESAPLAWAFGLLAAGGGLLVHRLRRRRS